MLKPELHVDIKLMGTKREMILGRDVATGENRSNAVLKSFLLDKKLPYKTINDNKLRLSWAKLSTIGNWA